MKPLSYACALLALLFLAPTASAQFNTTNGPLLTSTDAAWLTFPLFTVGDVVDGYIPPGILDGIGAQVIDGDRVRLYVNHELNAASGYAYSLANGTVLTGARITAFDVNRQTFDLIDAGIAYDRIVDRYRRVVTSAFQINEGAQGPNEGLDRLCSGSFFPQGRFGLRDAIYFAGEEVSNDRGGQAFALDVARRTLRAVPALGRAAFENVTLMDAGNDRVTAILIGDDRQGAPLYLYLGVKNFRRDGSFLDRNGLAFGQLFAWVSDGGDLSPQDFSGTDNSRTGRFVAVDQFDASQAGQPGYDLVGYADQATLDSLTAAAGAFAFSRPEDVATNPEDGSQALFASTGRGSAFPADDFGTTYLVDIDFPAFTRIPDGGELPEIPATLTILYDGDDAGAGQFPEPQAGLRNPDNLDWSDDGFGYIQEDRSTQNAPFGGTGAEEAAVWALDIDTGDLNRIARINRAAVPPGQVDTNPLDVGNWESSGVLDVSEAFGLPSSLTLLAADVQGHSLEGGIIDAANLVEGGQLLFLLGVRTPTPVRLAEGTSLSEAVTRFTEAQAASQAQPGEVALEEAYPNPFVSATTVAYALPAAGEVRLAVYDVLGRQVAVLVEGTVEAGQHTARLDAAGLAAGTYLVRLQAGDRVLTQRVTLVK